MPRLKYKYIYLYVYLLFQLCAICHEPFEQFWDEELEEWHLRDAIRVNDQTYHPICYEDHTDVSRHIYKNFIIGVGQIEKSITRISLA